MSDDFPGMQTSPQRGEPHSPRRLFLIVAASIMAAEVAVKFLFGMLPPLPPAMRNVLDGVLLMVLLFPVLYVFLYHPLRQHGAILRESTQKAEVAAHDMTHSPARFLLIVAVSIMVAEIAIMFLFEQLPPMPAVLESLVDGALLTILLMPVLYLFLFRPLSSHILALDVAEKSILQQNEELRDKTRLLMEAQEELVRREKLAVLGQVADAVGHELRNPLGVMNNAVYYLQAVLADADEPTREYLAIIKDEITAAERIVSDLLDAVRTMPPHPEVTSIAQLFEHVLHKCPLPPSIVFRVDFPASLPMLNVDGAQIQQVFSNLVCNGVEAMPEGGTLEIRARENEADGSVTVEVCDTGVGMTPEQLGKVFQPLFTTKARGIGLGLMVVRNLVQLNGGHIEVQSEAGKGSRFSVTLPAARLARLHAGR